MKRLVILISLLVALALVAAVQFVDNNPGSVQAKAIKAQEGNGEDAADRPEIPFLTDWASSGHANLEAEPFARWLEEDPPVVPTNCAKCHSTPGHLDFLGLDGTEAGVVDNDAPAGTTVE